MKTYQAPAVEHLGSFASLTNDKGTGSLLDAYNKLNNAGPCSADPQSCGWGGPATNGGHYGSSKD
ncbi:MAG: hypothetical protein ACE367_18540 [Acidimicrobiales bacterium]